MIAPHPTNRRPSSAPVRALCVALGAVALLFAGCADEGTSTNASDDASSDVIGGDTSGGDTSTDTSTTCADEGASCAGATTCCAGAVCIADGGAESCARTCTDDAACSDLPGTVCRSGAAGTAQGCLPPATAQCQSCTTDDDCAGTASRCVELGGGAVCLRSCTDDTGCADLEAGTTCLDDPAAPGVVTARVCTPPGGGCGCDDPDGDGYGTGTGCPQVGEDCEPMDGNRYPGATELCNELDDNCDGQVDELWDKSTDVDHCGSCGNACTSPAACTGGVCGDPSCGGTLADCDDDPTTCETDLATSTDHCLMCDNACTAGPDVAEVGCGAAGCEIMACTSPDLASCDGDLANGCETDLTTSLEHCGSCDNACDFGPNTIASCGATGCELVGCEDGFADCNMDPVDGCEVETAVLGECACDPGFSEPCYTGDPSTRNVGECSDGTRTCLPTGLFWGPCTGHTLPEDEICDNGLDEDCSGMPDDVVDEDGDGWTLCNGDCCEDTSCASDPAAVNPGAYDDPTNMVDDDCDGTVDNPPATTCSSGITISGVTGDDLARAMDLCTFVSEASGDWGVISAELLRADGSTPEPANVQVGVMNGFGSNVSPQANSTLAALSSGTARDQDGDGDDSGYVFPDGGGHQDGGNEVSAPSDYLDANGGQLQTASGCPNGDTTVNDSVQLRLRLRVPSNAQGLRYNFKFYSAEYPEWLCDSYNDFFLAMLYTNASGIPADHNISFDANGNPVSVNNAFFEVCDGCPSGTTELVGTGYPENDAGGTNWLFSTAPVVPGEVIELHFHIWDTGDHQWDSLVLLDNFEWQLAPTSVGTGEE